MVTLREPQALGRALELNHCLEISPVCGHLLLTNSSGLFWSKSFPVLGDAALSSSTSSDLSPVSFTGSLSSAHSLNTNDFQSLVHTRIHLFGLHPRDSESEELGGRVVLGKLSFWKAPQLIMIQNQDWELSSSLNLLFVSYSSQMTSIAPRASTCT